MPPKKKKATPKGAFYFFLLEIQERERRRGRPINLEQAKDIAGVEWPSITPEAKMRYEQKAKQDKERMRGSLERKYTSDGRSILHVLQQDAVKDDFKREMEQYIEEYLKCFNGDLDAIADEDFYFVSFNILCEVQGVFLPVEVGLIRYSIHIGVKELFHRFIKIPQIPLGYAGTAKEHSIATHKIPITDFHEGTDDYAQLLSDILMFIMPKQKDQPKVIYTLENHMEQAIGCLQYLFDQSNIEDEVRVFNILPLLEKLRRAADSGISRAEAEDFLGSNVFDGNMALSCDFHREQDVKYCAIAEAVRMGYKMSDALLTAYNITPTMYHLPPKVDEEMVLEISRPNIQPARIASSSRNCSYAPLKQIEDHTPLYLEANARSIHFDYPKVPLEVTGPGGVLIPPSAAQHRDYSSAREALMAGPEKFHFEGGDFPSLDEPRQPRQPRKPHSLPQSLASGSGLSQKMGGLSLRPTASEAPNPWGSATPPPSEVSLSSSSAFPALNSSRSIPGGATSTSTTGAARPPMSLPAAALTTADNRHLLLGIGRGRKLRS